MRRIRGIRPLFLAVAMLFLFACFSPVREQPADCGRVEALDAVFSTKDIVGPHYRLSLTRHGFRNAEYVPGALVDGFELIPVGWEEVVDPPGPWMLPDLVASPTGAFRLGGRDEAWTAHLSTRLVLEDESGAMRVVGPRRPLAQLGGRPLAPLPQMTRASELGVVCGAGVDPVRDEDHAFIISQEPGSGDVEFRWVAAATQCLDARWIQGELVVAAQDLASELVIYRVLTDGAVVATSVPSLGVLAQCRLDADGDLFCVTSDHRAALLRAPDFDVRWLAAPDAIEPIVFLNRRAFVAQASADGKTSVLSADLSLVGDPEFELWARLVARGPIGLDLRRDGAADLIASGDGEHVLRAVLCGGESR